MSRDPLSGFAPAVRDWFRASFAEPTAAQRKGWPPILAGRSTLLLAPTGSGKTLAAFLAAIDRLMFSPEPDKAERCRILYVSPLKALAVDVERNLRAPIAGIAASAAAPRPALSRPDRGDPLRRHAAGGARADRPHPAGHPDHDARVALPAADLARARAARVARDGHRRRDPRHGRHQARRAPLPLARAARGAAQRFAAEAEPLQRIGLSATQRPLEEIARLLGGGEPAARGAGWKPRPVEIVDAGSRKAFALTVEVPVEDMARLAADQPEEEIPSGPAAGDGAAPVDLAVDLPAAGRARPRPPLDDDLRQQPAPRRAARGRAERVRGRGARARAPRLGRAGEASGDRGSAEARRSARDRRDLLARARDRHGRGGPGDPDRGAALDRVGHAAHRPRGPLRRRGLPRDPVSQVPRRPPRRRGRDRADGGGPRRGDRLPAQPARRPRAADRGDRRVGRPRGR